MCINRRVIRRGTQNLLTGKFSMYARAMKRFQHVQSQIARKNYGNSRCEAPESESGVLTFLHASRRLFFSHSFSLSSEYETPPNTEQILGDFECAALLEVFTVQSSTVNIILSHLTRNKHGDVMIMLCVCPTFEEFLHQLFSNSVCIPIHVLKCNLDKSTIINKMMNFAVPIHILVKWIIESFCAF